MFVKADETDHLRPKQIDQRLRTVKPLGNAYKYDQLNRLLQAKSYNNLDMNTNSFGSGGSEMYFNAFSYDANGNILTQVRNDHQNSTIDDMQYKYAKDANGRIIQNRLYHVNDDTDYNLNDIDDMGLFEDDLELINDGKFNSALGNNYSYTEIGELESDYQEEIELIIWRVDGKVKEVHRSAGSSMKNLKFDYDAMGNRIAKHTYEINNTTLVKSTYYLRDAQGNVMSVYEHEVDNAALTLDYKLAEQHIYGSSRIGMSTQEKTMLGATVTEQAYSRELGLKQYELSNHLGNVLTVITDKKLPVESTSTTGEVEYFIVEILSATDYSSFGVTLEGRDFTSEKYRYGFQGQERDDELKGEGNSVNFSFRMHDTRLGRFFAVDPLARKYSFYSPYVFSGNRVINAFEFEGLEPTESNPNHTYTEGNVTPQVNPTLPEKPKAIDIGEFKGNPQALATHLIKAKEYALATGQDVPIRDIITGLDENIPTTITGKVDLAKYHPNALSGLRQVAELEFSMTAGDVISGNVDDFTANEFADVETYGVAVTFNQATGTTTGTSFDYPPGEEKISIYIDFTITSKNGGYIKFKQDYNFQGTHSGDISMSSITNGLFRRIYNQALNLKEKLVQWGELPLTTNINSNRLVETVNIEGINTSINEHLEASGRKGDVNFR